MAIRPIVRLGHPALRTPAEPVDLDQLGNVEMQQLIDDMFETMEAAGGVGLAAPQIGLSQQLFVYIAVDPEAATSRAADADAVDADPVDAEVADAEAKAGARGERKVLVNPGVEPQAGELVYDWEGCLSIPDLRGLVPRHSQVRVYAHDRHGNRVSFGAEGYEARIVMHEFDHLNGIVFLDRMRDLRSLAFGDEWEEFMTRGDDEGPAVG